MKRFFVLVMILLSFKHANANHQGNGGTIVVPSPTKPTYCQTICTPMGTSCTVVCY